MVAVDESETLASSRRQASGTKPARTADVSKLKVFICHASSDKPAARELYQRLKAEGFAPWLDEEDLLPGQNWKRVIPRAVAESHVPGVYEQTVQQLLPGMRTYLQNQVAAARAQQQRGAQS